MADDQALHPVPQRGEVVPGRHLVHGRSERLEQLATGDVLAERDAVHLVVAAGHVARRGDDDLGVEEPVGPPGDVLRAGLLVRVAVLLVADVVAFRDGPAHSGHSLADVDHRTPPRAFLVLAGSGHAAGGGAARPGDAVDAAVTTTR